MTGRVCRCGWAWPAFAALWLLAAGAQAQDVPVREIGIEWQGTQPRLSFSAKNLLDAEARQKLASGLPQVLEVTVLAYLEGQNTPVAVTARTCRVTFDVWEELYRLEIQTAASDRTAQLRTAEEVVQACLVVRDEPVAGERGFHPHRGRAAYFAVLAELNPLTADKIQRIRRWIARPTGGGFEGDAFFGSFVSLFVNRNNVGAAERRLHFRSQGVRIPR